MKDNYAKFGAMIGVSPLFMSGLMYLNTYALDHVNAAIFWKNRLPNASN